MTCKAGNDPTRPFHHQRPPWRQPAPTRRRNWAGTFRTPFSSPAHGPSSVTSAFFAATIRNANTRADYWRAVQRFFAWCEERQLVELDRIRPVHVSVYIEQMNSAPPTVKQHLAAIRRSLDWLASGGVLDINPAGSVKGPQHIVREGKTPLLDAEQTPPPAGFDPPVQRGGPAGPGHHRDDGLLLRAHGRRGGHERGRLLHEWPAPDVPAPREGRQGAPDAGPPPRHRLRGRITWTPPGCGGNSRLPCSRRPTTASNSPATGWTARRRWR